MGWSEWKKFGSGEIIEETFSGTSKTFTFEKPIAFIAIVSTTNSALSAVCVNENIFGYATNLTKDSDTQYTFKSNIGDFTSWNVYYQYK